MKKMLIVFMLLFTGMNLFSQTYEYSGDVWTVKKDYESNVVYAFLDLEESEVDHLGIDEINLKGVLFTFTENNDGGLVIIFTYLTENIQLLLPNYFLISNEDFDFRLIGGQRTNEDGYIIKEDSSLMYNMIYITLYKKDRINFLSIKEDIDIWIDEMNYNFNIVYGLPKEVVFEVNNFMEK